MQNALLLGPFFCTQIPTSVQKGVCISYIMLSTYNAGTCSWNGGISGIQPCIVMVGLYILGGVREHPKIRTYF